MNRIVLIAGGLLLAGGPTALAATIRVPEDYPTVLAGVDAAFPGDSVLVGPGTWTAVATRTVVIFGFPFSITACAFPKGGVTIVGTAGRDATILDGSVEDTGAGELHLVMFASRLGEGPLLIEGLSFTGARRSSGAGAISALGADGLVVRSCRFFENESIANEGVAVGAAIAGSDCDVELSDSQVDSNASIGGIVFMLDSNLIVRRCRFEGNRGRCVQFDSEALPFSVLVEDSDFVGNRGRGLGVGVLVTSTNYMTIQRCRFVENVAEEQPGGAVCIAGCYGRIQLCVFERDSCLASSSRGGAIRWEDNWGWIEHNTFVKCHSVLGGGAVAGAGGGSIGFAWNVVAHSTGGAAVNARGPILFGEGCNNYWLNAGGDFGEWTPAPSDFFTDPIFCAPETSDFTLREDSPCIVGGCGQVGALGIGCEAVSVEPTSWGRLKALFR